MFRYRFYILFLYEYCVRSSDSPFTFTVLCVGKCEAYVVRTMPGFAFILLLVCWKQNKWSTKLLFCSCWCVSFAYVLLLMCEKYLHSIIHQILYISVDFRIILAWWWNTCRWIVCERCAHNEIIYHFYSIILYLPHAHIQVVLNSIQKYMARFAQNYFPAFHSNSVGNIYVHFL